MANGNGNGNAIPGNGGAPGPLVQLLVTIIAGVVGRLLERFLSQLLPPAPGAPGSAPGKLPNDDRGEDGPDAASPADLPRPDPNRPAWGRQHFGPGSVGAGAGTRP